MILCIISFRKTKKERKKEKRKQERKTERKKEIPPAYGIPWGVLNDTAPGCKTGVYASTILNRYRGILEHTPEL